MVRSQLGDLLKRRRDGLAESWALRTISSSPRYAERPPEEVRGNLASLIDAIAAFIETDDLVPIRASVDRVSETRALQGFGLDDTLAVIFSGLQEALRTIKEECDATGHSADCFALANELMQVFSKITILHAESMEEMRKKTYAAGAILDMAEAYDRLDERSILDRAADTISNNYDLDVGIILQDSQRHLFVCRCDDPLVEESLKEGCGEALRSGETVSLDIDAELQKDNDGQPSVAPPSVTAVPIIYEGTVPGAVAVAARDDRPVSRFDTAMISSIAKYVGVASENSRLYLTVSDVAEKVSAERAQLFSMLSGMAASVYVADMDTYEILAVNRLLENGFGGGLVGRRCYEVLQTGQTGPCPFCTNDRLMKDGEPTGPVVWKFRNTVTGRWYNCIDSAIMWPNGKYVRLELAFDVTEAENARTELENVKNLLELYNDILLHDLGNFAGTSLAYIDLVLENTSSEAPKSEHLESARSQISKCQQLLGKVSRFSRALTTTDVAREEVDLNGVLDGAIEDVIEMHAEAKPVINKGYDAEPHMAKVGAFVKDVFVNLLANAVKYGEGKDIDATIDDDKLGELPAWRISIADRGPGIPPEQRGRLFQRYSRLERAGSKKGTGLGLSIAKTITERYGGELRVSDRVEGDHTKGACFVVVLPQ